MTATKLGDKKALSSPNIFQETIWFQGENNLLWHMPLGNPGAAVNPQGLKTLSTPMPSLDGHVYFQGENNALSVITYHKPFMHGQLGTHKCVAPPFAPGDGYVYFVTEEFAGGLYRVNTRKPEDFTYLNKDGEKCSGTPALPTMGNGFLYYRGSNDSLRRLTIHMPTENVWYGEMSCYDSPVIGTVAHNVVCVMGGKTSGDRKILLIDPLDATKYTIFDDQTPQCTPRPPEFGSDSCVYFREKTTNDLVKFNTETKVKTVLAQMQGSPDPQGDGYVIFWGTDGYIYKVPTT
jgi:hypothetical protein